MPRGIATALPHAQTNNKAKATHVLRPRINMATNTKQLLLQHQFSEGTPLIRTKYGDAELSLEFTGKRIKNCKTHS
jgi:hypothetical protein